MNTTASVLVVAVTLGLAACSSTPVDTTLATPAPCRADRFASPFHELDPCQAEAVLTAAVSTIFGYRPREHADPRAAFRAASALMDPRFAERAEPAALVWSPITAEQFQRWQHEGVELATTVRITADDHPAATATATAASRVLAVTVQPEDQPGIEFAVYAHASRASDASAWLLTGMEVAA
ncbi:hypothetical protein [Nocardia lijiangensis]|uniref:hypothetical protein n=1 Tax=Nocardia lijiangensis TaxID=299618 RepID=UPI00082B6C48|nr:hypothetical protein [Nocardia lijiangensis]